MAATVSPASLSPKARGWLAHLWRKATTPDDWSITGEPHPWWDRYSLPPMLSFPRFDLSESSYALLIMARKTPAWREVYTRILDELIRRHTTFWAAVDWLTQIGPDPDRARYPDAYRALIPAHLWGRYDVPGWTANGVEPWGLAPDPIGSAGNLFFRGFFNLLLAVHRTVSGAATWEAPFEVAGLDDRVFPWTHTKINAFLSDQWAGVWHGPHCENTKVWPFCLSAAGLGLQLSDRVLGSEGHWVVDRWVEEFLKTRCIGYNTRHGLEWVGVYYDPQIDYVHGKSAGSGLFPAIYLAPQQPAFAEELYRRAADHFGWSAGPAQTPPPTAARTLTLGYLLAREFGDARVEANLAGALEAVSEGRFFSAGEGAADEFGYFFNFGEPYPRGQESALCMLADVSAPGEWTAAFGDQNAERFSAPTVEGVNFPDLGIARAANDVTTGVLTVETYAGRRGAAGRPTRFRVTGLPDVVAVRVERDGHAFHDWRIDGDNAIALSCPIGAHRFSIYTGWRAAAGSPAATDRPTSADRREPGPIVRGSAKPDLASTAKAIEAGLMSCPCCR